MTPIDWFAGNIGDISKGSNPVHCTLAGLSDALQDMIGKVYQPTCRRDLGDAYAYAVVAGVLTRDRGGRRGPAARRISRALAQNGTVTSVIDPARTFNASGLTGAGPRDIYYTAEHDPFQ